MLHAAEALNSIYTCLSSAAWDQAVFRDAAQRFLLLAGQLEAFFEKDKIFRVKPKAHQLVGLAGHDINPSKIWIYRDESYGLTLTVLGRRRGGIFSMHAVSCQVLANKLPRLQARPAGCKKCCAIARDRSPSKHKCICIWIYMVYIENFILFK